MRTYSKTQKAFVHRGGFCFAYSLFVALLLLGSCYSSEAENPAFPIHIEKISGEIVSYQVEIAATPKERAYGLMNRKYMTDSHGMIFLEKNMKPRLISMWMKNTYIPLDMVFINEEGLISSIHKGAVPHDLSSISSLTPAIAVIELNAGQVKKMNLHVGDRVLDYKKFWNIKKALE